jgi:sugar lactone lactonase YvrE
VPRAAGPFNSCTKVAIAPNDELYVSDGYGNARVHRFAADGTLLQSWGEPGRGPGQFYLPHGILVHEGRVIVCDRENDRLQFFDLDGNYLEQWTGLQAPCNVVVDAEGNFYVVELSMRAGRRSPGTEAKRGRVSVLSPTGELLARWGEFIASHGIAVDSHGDVYVSETTWTLYGRYGEAPEGYPQIQRFVRAG